jgi:membrane protein implicated in regulation of membrane protease activity
MTWADFYLICFVIGFALSVLSLLGGAHLHIPHLHLHVHVPHVHMPDVHAPHAGAGEVPVFNFGTLAAFLVWFGATGYLLVKFSSLWVFFSLGIAGAAGLIGGAIIFLFLAKVLMREEENLDPADYDMVGVLGRLSLPIRRGGTGEIVFAQAGTRHCAGARSEDGAEIAKGAEVVVTRYEKGIAYVERWEDLAGTAETDK